MAQRLHFFSFSINNKEKKISTKGKIDLLDSLFIWMTNVRGSPTLTGPETRVPEGPKPFRISMLHCGGGKVKTTGLPVRTFTAELLGTEGLVPVYLLSFLLRLYMYSSFDFHAN